MSGHNGWYRVTRQHPCPICKKPDNCAVSDDESHVWCGRVSEGAIKENAGGQYLHRLKVGSQAGHSWKPYAGDYQQADWQPNLDWATYAQRCTESAAPQIEALSKNLGVSYSALTSLGVGWSDYRKYYTFPERDGEGRVIGIQTRDLSGNKRRMKGSRAGLSFGTGWKSGKSPIYLVEGASDTAALTTIDLAVVGRPSNNAGVPLLTELLFDVPIEREIIVVGERDQKPDGRWPGKQGAISVATRLAENLDRPIGWGFPPDDAKDSRAWLLSMPKLPRERLANLFVTGGDVTLVQPPITLQPEEAPGKAHSVDEWRGSMRTARLESLTQPGINLDRSSTGSGKSRVDFQAVLQLLRGGAAA